MQAAQTTSGGKNWTFFSPTVVVIHRYLPPEAPKVVPKNQWYSHRLTMGETVRVTGVMANDLRKTSERGFRVQIMGTANVPLLDSLHDSTLSCSIHILLD